MKIHWPRRAHRSPSARGVATLLLTATVAVAAPPETQRVVHEIVRQGGKTAVALGIDYTYYSDPPERGMPEHEVRAWCASLPPGERDAAPECLALDDFDKLKIADTDTRALLYEPGEARQACRSWFRRFGIDTEAYRDGMAEATVRFIMKWRNDDFVRIVYRIDNTRGPHHSTSGSLLMRFDHDSGAYRAASFNDYTAHNEAEYAALVVIESLMPEHNGYKKIPAPAALKAWRYGRSGASVPAPDPAASEVEKRRDDATLHLRQESLPHDDTPFVVIDPDELDEDARRLQQQMLTMLLAEDGVVPFEECLDTWHPDAHKTLRTQWETRAQDPDPWKGYAFFTYGGGTPATDTTLIRLVARVRWDDGVVWYGWVPQRQGRLHDEMMPMFEEKTNFVEHMAPAAQRPDRIVFIRQRRGPDGVYLFATQSMPGADSAHQLTMRMLSDIALAESIVREHGRGAPIAAEPPGDR